MAEDGGGSPLLRLLKVAGSVLLDSGHGGEEGPGKDLPGVIGKENHVGLRVSVEGHSGEGEEQFLKSHRFTSSGRLAAMIGAAKALGSGKTFK